MWLKDYLTDHLIVKNKMNASEYACVEVIVDNPYELLSIVQDSEYYISHISWWDSVKMGDSSLIGYGGMMNTRNPNFYFAETDMSRSFDAKTTKKEYVEYLLDVKQSCSKYNLFPAFDIKFR